MSALTPEKYESGCFPEWLSPFRAAAHENGLPAGANQPEMARLHHMLSGKAGRSFLLPTEAAETIYESFLEQLPSGIYVNGIYVCMEPDEAEWMDEKDHILKSKVAVQLLVLCNGGVYIDTDYLQTDKVDIQVRKE